MAASSNAGPTSDSSIKKKVKDSPPTSHGSVAESPLSLIVRYISFLSLILHLFVTIWWRLLITTYFCSTGIFLR